MITTSSPIVGKGGTVAEALDFLGGPPQYDTEVDYTNELFHLCSLVGFDFRILFAQFCHETADGTSKWWIDRNNPAGIGITGDAKQDAASHTWTNGIDAARAHVVHMCAYVFGNVSGAPDRQELLPYLKLDPRWNAVIEAGFAGSVHKLGDLGNGKWAADPNYATQIAAKANRIFPDTGGTTMGLYAVAGLATKIELPVPLIQAIVPAGQTNQRPGIKLSTPLYWTQHETANTANGADAAMHARYLLNGGNGGQVSWHFTVDDHQIYQHIPIDEVTWQAADGGGPGNMNSISCEMAVNADGDEAKARHNTEALAAAICKAKGIPVANVKRHYDWNAGTADRHHCPDHMMNQNYWPTFVANVGALIAGGTAVAEPFAITWEPGAVGVQTIGETKALALLGEVTAKRALPLRQSVSSTSPVVHTLKAGEKATIVGTYRDPKTSRRWAFIKFADGKYGRCLLSAVTPSFPTL